MVYRDPRDGAGLLEGLMMTDWAETCRPDIYIIVYKTNVVLLTEVYYLILHIIWYHQNL